MRLPLVPVEMPQPISGGVEKKPVSTELPQIPDAQIVSNNMFGSFLKPLSLLYSNR